jgi:hypothetical protein
LFSIPCPCISQPDSANAGTDPSIKIAHALASKNAQRGFSFSRAYEFLELFIMVSPMGYKFVQNTSSNNLNSYTKVGKFNFGN